MTRARSGLVSKNRHKKILKLAKGFRGRNKSCFKSAAASRVEKSLQYAYRDRRNRKRDFRRLWIQRINAAARIHDMNYSTLINGLKKADVQVDRKMLAELAVHNEKSFAEIAKVAKKAL